jgi:hypothetical protein
MRAIVSDDRQSWRRKAGRPKGLRRRPSDRFVGLTSPMSGIGLRQDSSRLLGRRSQRDCGTISAAC